YFPNPDSLKKKRNTGKKSVEENAPENPYKSIIRWFDAGNQLDLLLDMKDSDRIEYLYKVDGLYGVVKKYFPQANDQENAILMEFVLHGLASYSLISKKSIEGKISFKDLMGSMMNLGSLTADDDDFTEEDYQ
ncbi:MAG: hypothetical protein RL596_1517, partial [Bacteroidota bacterium]